MNDLRKMCKKYGAVKIGYTTWVWDFAMNDMVKDSDMPPRSERKRASELAKWKQAAQKNQLMRP